MIFQAIDLLDSKNGEIVEILHELGDIFSLIAKKYLIPPFFDRAIEKYYNAHHLSFSQVMSIQTMRKIAKSIYTSAILKSKIDNDFEAKLFLIANEKYTNVYQFIKELLKQKMELSPSKPDNLLLNPTQGLIPPLFKTSILKYKLYRTSVPSIFSKFNVKLEQSNDINKNKNNNNNDGENNDNNKNVNENENDIGEEYKTIYNYNDIQKKSTVNLNIEQEYFDLLVEWGELETKQAKLSENLGDLRLALRLYYTSYIKFYKALKTIVIFLFFYFIFTILN